MKAGQLRKGMYVLAKDEFPCKILEVTTSKTGKHGHAKAHITCVDIFTDKKYEINEPTSHNLMCPNVEKDEYPLVDMDDEGRVTYMEKSGDYNDTLVIDPSTELFKIIKNDLANEDNNILVSVTSAMNQSMVVSHRKE
jgi:translation initiation factor 5A